MRGWRRGFFPQSRKGENRDGDDDISLSEKARIETWYVPVPIPTWGFIFVSIPVPIPKGEGDFSPMWGGDSLPNCHPYLWPSKVIIHYKTPIEYAP